MPLAHDPISPSILVDAVVAAPSGKKKAFENLDCEDHPEYHSDAFDICGHKEGRPTTPLASLWSCLRGCIECFCGHVLVEILSANLSVSWHMAWDMGFLKLARSSPNWMWEQFDSPCWHWMGLLFSVCARPRQRQQARQARGRSTSPPPARGRR